MINWRLGTMGFSDPDWVGTFYPRGIKSGEHLPFYSGFFNTIELDTTFHAEPTPDRIDRWSESVPADFRFCVKTPKAITHGDVLDAAAAVAMKRFLAVLETFGAKLGVVLVQFPPTFGIESFALLKAFLSSIDARRQIAIEFRNRTWDTDRTEHLLREHRCIWVAGDYLEDPWPIRMTADDLYVRWIGKHEQFASHLSEQQDMTDRLQWWKKRIDALPKGTEDGVGITEQRFLGKFSFNRGSHAEDRRNQLPDAHPRRPRRAIRIARAAGRASAAVVSAYALFRRGRRLALMGGGIGRCRFAT